MARIKKKHLIPEMKMLRYPEGSPGRLAFINQELKGAGIDPTRPYSVKRDPFSGVGYIFEQ